jgi:hypothetical protein
MTPTMTSPPQGRNQGGRYDVSRHDAATTPAMNACRTEPQKMHPSVDSRPTPGRGRPKVPCARIFAPLSIETSCAQHEYPRS